MTSKLGICHAVREGFSSTRCNSVPDPDPGFFRSLASPAAPAEHRRCAERGTLCRELGAWQGLAADTAALPALPALAALAATAPEPEPIELSDQPRELPDDSGNGGADAVICEPGALASASLAAAARAFSAKSKPGRWVGSWGHGVMALDGSGCSPGRGKLR